MWTRAHSLQTCRSNAWPTDIRQIWMSIPRKCRWCATRFGYPEAVRHGATTMSQLECTKLPFLTLENLKLICTYKFTANKPLPEWGGNINRHACVLLISRYSSIISRIELHHTFREDDPKLWWNLTSCSWCLWSIHSRATPSQ